MISKHISCKAIGCKGGQCKHYFMDCDYSKAEIDFAGSNLQTTLINASKDKLEEWKGRCQGALNQFPKSVFWKESVEYLERRGR